MKRFFCSGVLLLALLCLRITTSQAQQLPVLPASNLNFMVSSDMGRRNDVTQTAVAAQMTKEMEAGHIAFLLVAGDPIHDDGVTSVDDNEWKLKIEDIYPPSLKEIPWYIVAGNHEYQGSVQALMDYSATHTYWNMPSRYYAFEREIDGRTCLFVMIDTTPLIDKYRTESNYGDAAEQDMQAELKWIDETLKNSDAYWKFVIGHHPVYANTNKADQERTDMQDRLKNILEKAGVDFYISGHIHNFQYIRPQGEKVHYVVNSSASIFRKVESVEDTIFSSGDPGFTVFSVSKNSSEFFFVNDKGEIVYSKKVVK